jgi:altronate hydrolase
LTSFVYRVNPIDKARTTPANQSSNRDAQMTDYEGTIRLNERDNVIVLTRAFPAGTKPAGSGRALEKNTLSGHKVATADIALGAPVVKFGQIIGYASVAIAAGEHVHTHNCAMGSHDQDYKIGEDYQPTNYVSETERLTFKGYRRADGGVGTRNYIALCATVNCSATVIRHIADHCNRSGLLDDYPNIDGVIALAHGTGCGMASSGEGYDTLQRVLWGHATHPNVGAAIFVGLGCEVMQIGRMKSMFGSKGEERFHGLTIQETGGTRKTIAAGIESIKALLPMVNAVERVDVSISELTLGLQCGGSDGFSGITANPALGATTDLLVRHGGTALLSETPEIYGAEQLLVRRAASKEVGEKLIERIRWWERYTEMNGGSMDNHSGKITGSGCERRNARTQRRVALCGKSQRAWLCFYGFTRLRPSLCNRSNRIRRAACYLHDRAWVSLRLKARTHHQDRDQLSNV